MRIDLTRYRNEHSRRSKAARLLWSIVWLFLFRTSPRFLRGWRRWLLRIFGARIGRGVYVCPSARFWAPWRVEIGDHSWVGDHVDCYSVDTLRIGSHAVVSQYAFLCTAEHDIADPSFSLITAPIHIGDGAWLAADVFVGPGVTVGEGAVVGVRSTVLRDVEEWTVVGGSPARFIKKRVLEGGVGECDRGSVPLGCKPPIR
jgi:putative colanic acid biosynthesis acetyltransferase WcaF